MTDGRQVARMKVVVQDTSPHGVAAVVQRRRAEAILETACRT
jgi:hypothetical protein